MAAGAANGDFNPRSPCGERHGGEPDQGDCLEFQSTLPVRGATITAVCKYYLCIFQSTLPVRGATHRANRYVYLGRNFNPRSPCGERLLRRRSCSGSPLFQSTLPVRGATIGTLYAEGAEKISIHAPRAGSDSVGWLRPSWCNDISIHAPRAGSDVDISPSAANSFYFNPRSPCGERLGGVLALFADAVFQSTLPVRGATQHNAAEWCDERISIHAPRAGSDC